MSETDKALIARAATGENKAFDELVLRHQSKLRYSLLQLTGWDESLADDLAQEAFIRAYRGIAGFRQDALFTTWLYKIAYHVYLGHLQKKSVEFDYEFELADLDGGIMNTSGNLHRDIAKALAKLSLPQRSAVHLFLHRQCSHQEISETLGMPLGSVKTNIKRGRERLAVLLSDWK